MTAARISLDIVYERRTSWGQARGAHRAIDGHAPEVQQLLLSDFDQIAGPENLQLRHPDPAVRERFRVLSTWDVAHKALSAKAAHLHQLQNLSSAMSEGMIKSRAQLSANTCMQKGTLAQKLDMATRHGCTLPKGQRVTKWSLIARLHSPDWWEGQYRRLWPRQRENMMRDLGLVSAHRALYVSDIAMEGYRLHVLAMQQACAQMDLFNIDTGEVIPLAGIRERSMANPKNRNTEMMVLARGLEEYATAAGHSCVMVTATTPSRFHAVHSESGERNDKYDGSTVRDAQQWLCDQWAMARAALGRRGIRIYGWRVAEPHHDGTPHWHLIVYADQADTAAVTDILRAVWLSDSGDEPGAQLRRINFTQCEAGKAGGPGYLGKYIAKNMEGAAASAFDAESLDESAGATIETARERAVCWSRVHGIRQFQGFGQPLKSLWRECRRLQGISAEHPMQSLHLAATGGDGARVNPCLYLTELKGHTQWRECSRELLEYDAPYCTDPDGRRVLRVTRWGELPADRPVGVKCIRVHHVICAKGRIVDIPRWVRTRTRDDNFRLIFRPSSELGPVALTVRDMVSDAAASGLPKTGPPGS